MKPILLTLLFLLASTALHADPISRQTARQQAALFVQRGWRTVGGTTVARHLASANVELWDAAYSDSSLYIFNIGTNDGFVIVSTDDRTDPILAYSDTGTFDEKELPENARAWLKSTNSLPLPPPKGRGDGRFKTSTCSNVTWTLLWLAFSRAILSASSEMSHAVTSASGISAANVQAMHPLPVPISKIEYLSLITFRCSLPTIHWQSSSVSGRGISTYSLTINVRPQKSVCPKTYWMGSPCNRRLAISSNSVWQSADNCVSLPMYMSDK